MKVLLLLLEKNIIKIIGWYLQLLLFLKTSLRKKTLYLGLIMKKNCLWTQKYQTNKVLFLIAKHL